MEQYAGTQVLQHSINAGYIFRSCYQMVVHTSSGQSPINDTVHMPPSIHGPSQMMLWAHQSISSRTMYMKTINSLNEHYLGNNAINAHCPI